MGTALLTIKIMPDAIEANLEEIKLRAQEVAEKGNATKVRFEEQPIAFGLKAVILYFDIDESNELDPIEESLKKIEHVNSVQVIDMRRAFG